LREECAQKLTLKTKIKLIYCGQDYRDNSKLTYHRCDCICLNPCYFSPLVISRLDRCDSLCAPLCVSKRAMWSTCHRPLCIATRGFFVISAAISCSLRFLLCLVAAVQRDPLSVQPSPILALCRCAATLSRALHHCSQSAS